MQVTLMVPVTVEVPDGTPSDAVKIVTTTGFSVDHPMAEQPDTSKLYGDSNEAYAAAVRGNEAEHAVKFRVLRSTPSVTVVTNYRVWPISEQAGWVKPPGWYDHVTPTEQPSPAPQSFPPAPEGTHDDGLGGPVDPLRTGGQG